MSLMHYTAEGNEFNFYSFLFSHLTMISFISNNHFGYIFLEFNITITFNTFKIIFFNLNIQKIKRDIV